MDGNGIHTDFRNPAVLIYEPQADGSLELVTVENLVFEKAWAETGHSEPVADGPHQDGHTHMPEAAQAAGGRS